MLGLCFLAAQFLVHVPLRTSIGERRNSQQQPPELQPNGNGEQAPVTNANGTVSRRQSSPKVASRNNSKYDRSDVTSLHQVTVVEPAAVTVGGADILTPRADDEDYSEPPDENDYPDEEVDLSDVRDTSTAIGENSILGRDNDRNE